MTAIAAATTTTKAASGGVEEGSKDVGSFGGKKKTAANDDIPSDVARESPSLSSTSTKWTAATSKASPAGVVVRGPRGSGGIPDNRGGKAAGRKEYAERQPQMRQLSDKRRAADKAESGLWAEREALGHLAAERDARQDTIRLRSAEEMAVRAVRRLPQKSAKIAI